MSASGRIRLTACMALVLFLPAATPSQSGLVRVDGRVSVELEEDHLVPVQDALVEVYRLDVKEYRSARTDRSGGFAVLGLSNLGTYLILVSGPGIEPLWANRIEVRNNPNLHFVSMPGDGRRLGYEEATELIRMGRSREVEFWPDSQRSLRVQLAYTSEEKKRRYAALEEHERAIKRAEADQARFERVVAQYNRGVEHLKGGYYQPAIDELAGVIAAELTDDREYAELRARAYSSIAEARYQVAVDLVVLGQPYAARPELEAGLEAVRRAIASFTSLPASSPDLLRCYLTYARIVRRQIEHYGNTSNLVQAVADLGKASGLEPDSKRWHVHIGDLYRLAGRPDDAVQFYESVLENEPDNLDAMFGLGMSLALLERPGAKESAIGALEAFLSRAASHDVRGVQAETQLRDLKR